MEKLVAVKSNKISAQNFYDYINNKVEEETIKYCTSSFLRCLRSLQEA